LRDDAQASGYRLGSGKFVVGTVIVVEGWNLGRESWHFHRRLWERCRVRLQHGEYAAILKSVRKGRAVLLRRNAGSGIATYAVRLRSGAWIRIVAGKSGLVTVLGRLPGKEMRQSIENRRRSADQIAELERLAGGPAAPPAPISVQALAPQACGPSHKGK
jgi:hypothetical protein